MTGPTTDSLEQQLSWYPPDISPGEVEIPVGTSILRMGDGRWKPLWDLSEPLVQTMQHPWEPPS